MKIKFLSLLLIIAAIIVISGCVDEEAQGFNYKAREDLTRTIFFPYVGLLDHGESKMSDPHPHEFPPDEFNSGPESMHTLENATSLLDRNIETAEMISLKLKAGIERYKAEGEDVSRLETLLEKYNRLIKEAKQYRALANVTSGEENNSSIANSSQYNSSSENIEVDYLIQSQKSMMQANRVLKDIFEELNSLMGREELNNTSRLTSVGEGKAILMGSFTLNMHLEDGDMAIMGLSRDSEIDINGDYKFEKNTDKHDTVRLYHINSANVKISGSHKTVILNNNNITLTADGEGYVTFQGDGTYSVEEEGRVIKEDKWAKPFFEEGMNPQKPGPEGKYNNTRYGPDKNDNDITIGQKKGMK